MPVLILVGVTGLLAGYYWVHKPLGLGLLQVLGGAVLDLLTVGAVLILAGSAAHRLLQERVDLQILTRGERLALESGLGLGGVSLLVLVMGLVGLLQRWALWAFMALLLLIAWPVCRGWLADWRKLVQAAQPKKPWTWFLASFSLLMFGTGLLHALAPPAAWDALMYHLVGPQQYLLEGAIRTQAENHYLGFPQGVEVLYTLTIGLTGRETAAAPIHTVFGGILLLAAAALTRRYTDAATAWLSVALLLGSYSLWLLLAWPYVDLGVMAYTLLTLIAVNQWRETGGTAWLMIAGVFAGLLVGVKYTAGMVAIALAVYVLWQEPRHALRNLLLLAVPALLVFLPWLAKGLLLYGNPVYPFLFHGVNWDAMRGENFGQTDGGMLRRGTGWQLPLLPVMATIFGIEKGPGYAFTVGPWLLTAPLLLMIGWRWLDDPARTLARRVLPLLGLLLLQWIALAAISDLGAGVRQTGAAALAMSSVAAVLGFYAISCGPNRSFNLNFILRTIVGFTLVLAFIEGLQVTLRHGMPDYFAGQMRRDSYLYNQLGAYGPAMQQLADLPVGSQVRFLWEPRSFYCPAEIVCKGDVLTDFWAAPIARGQMPEAVLEGWRTSGDDYLLVWDIGFDFYTTSDESDRFAEQNSLFPAARDRWLEPVWTDGLAYTLYRWRES